MHRTGHKTIFGSSRSSEGIGRFGNSVTSSQSYSGFWRHWGPYQERSCCANWTGNIPLEAQFAGLTVPWTLRQYSNDIASDIPAILFHTRVLNRLGLPRNHPSTTRLSVQANILRNSIPNVCAKWLRSFASMRPPHNSKRGIDNRFIGATVTSS